MSHSMKTLQKDILVLFRLYNLETICNFRILFSRKPQLFLDGGVSPQVWPVLNDKHSLFDFTYDL